MIGQKGRFDLDKAKRELVKVFGMLCNHQVSKGPFL